MNSIRLYIPWYFHNYARRAFPIGFLWSTLLMAGLLTWIANIGHSLAMAANNMPAVLQTQCYVALLFVAADTLSGVYVAGRAGQLKSSKLRNYLFAKMMQYSCIMVLSSGIGMLTKNWIFPESGASAIIMFEGLSLIENMSKIEQYGVNMGPIRPLLAFFAKYMDSSPSEVLTAADIGKTGATGRTGAQGPPGQTGAQGVQGIPGQAGPAGASVTVDITSHSDNL